MLNKCLLITVASCALLYSSQLDAQQTVLSVPHGRITERWYENIGSSCYLEQNFRRGGWFFNWGAPVIPPYGGYDGRDARFGAGFRFGNLRGRFNLWASQGMDRSLVMEAPYLTVPHGGFGSFQHGSLRPFVTGWVPVVGSQPQWQYPLRNYVNASGADSLTVISSGTKSEETIERVPQTLQAPTEDPPLTLINGEEYSAREE